MYTGNSRKSTYLTDGRAKQVITTDAKKLAENMQYEYKKTNGGKDWYDLSLDERNEWIDKARDRFEIREFIENKKQIMKEVDFSGLDTYTYTFARDSLQEAFDDVIEEYGLDIGISMFEDVKSHIESEYEASK